MQNTCTFGLTNGSRILSYKGKVQKSMRRTGESTNLSYLHLRLYVSVLYTHKGLSPALVYNDLSFKVTRITRF